MDKANITMYEYLTEQLEREDEGKEKEEAVPRQERNEDERTDPEERGSEKAENVPAPTDVDDEDMTLGEFFNEKNRISEDFEDVR